MLRPYKFLVVPVVQELDDDGNVIGERQTQEPAQVFGVQGLHEYADGFDDVLAQQQARMNGAKEKA
jgi:hypothetical protein